ncbi:MAG TPA: signal peptide peptidase SppA [Caulobacteraceae bacterium]|jgi:protease-4
MKTFLITVAGVLVGLTLFALAAPIVVIALISAAARPAPTPDRAVLSLDLRGGLTDQAPTGAFAFLGGKGQSVMAIEATLRHAESDDRIKGLFVRLPETGMAPAAADELRLAFQKFRAHGKFITAHAQGLYAEGLVTSTYELAAASGDLWLQPGSAFQVTGLSKEDMFFKRMFDRFGLNADFQQRYEYKTAVNPFLYDNYTPAHRESELSWMGSVYDTAINAAASDRGRPLATIKSLIEAGPYSAEDAKTQGLIDRVGQPHEAEQSALSRAGDGAKLVDFGDYAGLVRGPSGFGIQDGPKVAVISAEGAIMTGRDDSPSPLGGEQTIRSDQVSKAFYDAIKDKDVKAIVFRVSSPGGSDTASEQILASVRAAKAAGKPVVVSMGTYGASGGYWIASEANEIVAEPSTLTGSIGVFGGKFVIGPALAKWGVDVHSLNVGGPYAGASDAGAPMTPQQKAAFSAWMDRIYDGFVARVALGRRLPEARVREIARGRVWTGAQAKTLGLVDQVGGFYDAVDRAKALGGIVGEARLQPFGAAGSAFEAIQRLFGGQASVAPLAALGLDVRNDPELQALLAAARDARLRAEGATVLAPLWIR